MIKKQNTMNKSRNGQIIDSVDFISVQKDDRKKYTHKNRFYLFSLEKQEKNGEWKFVCVSLAQEINKLSRIICLHSERGIESLQTNDFTIKISFYSDEISH